MKKSWVGYRDKYCLISMVPILAANCEESVTKTTQTF